MRIWFYDFKYVYVWIFKKVVLFIGYDKLINIINEYNFVFIKFGKIKIFLKMIVFWR